MLLADELLGPIFSLRLRTAIGGVALATLAVPFNPASRWLLAMALLAAAATWVLSRSLNAARAYLFALPWQSLSPSRCSRRCLSCSCPDGPRPSASPTSSHRLRGGIVSRTCGDRLLVEVSDDGDGVPDDRTELIFERGAAGTQPSSVGLGLSVSRELAPRMGGELSYRREPAESVFTLDLPAAGVESIALVG